jgi:dipeptide/tripeptide permease
VDALPYFLSFAAVFFVFSFGLFHRKVWVWYGGWVVLYLVASYDGRFFFSALDEAKDRTQMAYACVYLVGGLLFWLPSVGWWASQRTSFGIRAGRSKQSASNESNQN